jgi:putative ABC transport system permease protein
MGTLWKDILYSARVLAKKPSFTIIAILTLTLGIGANIAIFSVVNAVLLRPLPFDHPDQLVRVFADLNGPNVRNVGTSVPELEDLRERAGVFDQVAAMWPISAALTGGDRPERIELLATSANYFQLLGVTKAQLGRLYGPQDALPGFSDAVVISDGLWRRLFGSDPNVIGRKIHMDTDPYTIVGVMPPDFRHPGETVQGGVEIWAPCGFTGNPFPVPTLRSQNFLPGTIGRLKSGVTLERAQTQIDSLSQHLRETYPKEYPTAAKWGLRLEAVQENLTGKVRPILNVLLAAVGFVLLIACVNVASLILARSSGQVREMAIRRALGASRSRLVRQLLTESFLLSLGGCGAAMVAIAWLKKSLIAMMPSDLPRLNEIHFDWRVVAFAFALSIGTAVLFGLVPALRISAVNPNVDLKESGRSGGASLRHNRFRSALVSAEIALSLVLLIGAGLLVRSFSKMLQVNPGLDPSQVGIAQIWIPVPNDPSANPYLKPASRSTFAAEVLRRVSGITGVEMAAMGGGFTVPFSGGRNTSSFRWADDAAAGGGRSPADADSASPDFFRALKIPLVNGRFFSDDDSGQQQRVLVVNQTFVNRYSPQRSPLGRTIFLGNGTNPARIVGVVGDIRDAGLDVPVQPRIYLDLLQSPAYALTVYFRTTNSPALLNDSIVRAVHSVNSELPVYGLRTMKDQMAASEARRIFVLRLMEIFAAVALLLAALGTYGVMSYAMNQRTQEIGIRVALGAQRGDVVRLALRPGLILASIGIAIGIVASLFLTQLMSSLLFGVGTTDAATFIGVSLLLMLVALVACCIPARRATNVDPMVALRYE